MNKPGLGDVATDEVNLDRAELLDAVHKFLTPLETVENIHQYNTSHSDTPIILFGLGSEYILVRSYCAMLNELSETEQERAQELATVFRGMLGGPALIFLSVWCDIRELL